MTDSIEAGSDDDAIAGEQVGYVPCRDAAAAVDAADDSEAVDGRGEGYVPDGTQAGDFADSDDGQAVYGSAVGFVAKPCSEEGCTDKVIDDFDRGAAAYWGSTSPDTYGAWDTGSPLGTTAFTVNGTQGVIVAGHTTPLGTAQGGAAVLTGSFPTGPWPWEAGDFTARVRFQLDTNGTGSPDIIFDFGTTHPVRMYLQHGTGVVKIGIFRSAYGIANEVTVAIPTLNAVYAFETEYQQSTGLHRARMYLDGGAVPDWQLSRDSSGDPATVSAGMRVLVDPADASPDVTYRIEDITYDLCCADMPVVFDDFTRTVSPGGWDNATPSTLAWSVFSGTASHFSVAGTYGQIRTGAGGPTSDKIAVDAPADTFWSANGYEMNAEFTLGNYIPISALDVTIAERTGTSLFMNLLIGTDPTGANPPGSSAPGPGYWGYSISGDTDVYGPAIAWALGTYHIRAVARPGIDLQVKVWNVLDAEPSTFTVVANTSNPFVSGSHDFRIDAFNNDFGNIGHVFTDVQFDYIEFTTCI